MCSRSSIFPVIFASRAELHNFSAEAVPPVAISLIANVNHACHAAKLLVLLARDFFGHVNGHLYGHANLKGRGRREIKPAARQIQRFREVIALVRRNTGGTKTERSADPVACQLSAILGVHGLGSSPRDTIESSLPHAARKGNLSVADPLEGSSINPWYQGYLGYSPAVSLP